MDLISIIILGIVQGITEWIPISSKTQDTLVYLKFLGGDQSQVIPILLFLHIGTLLAAIIYFRKEIIGLTKAFIEKPLNLKSHANSNIGFLFTSLIFTGLIGLPLLFLEKKLFPEIDGSLLFLLMGVGLIVTGILLLNQKSSKNNRTKSTITWKDGILTGSLQGLSILPGVSRSGTTTTGLIWRGFDSESSFYLSFLLSIPTVIAAEILFYIADLFFPGGTGFLSFSLIDGILLIISSFIFGYLSLDIILKIVKKVNLSYLVLGLGVVVIIASIFGLN